MRQTVMVVLYRHSHHQLIGSLYWSKRLLERPSVKRFALCYRTVVLYVLFVLSVLSILSVCDVRALWPNDWMDQDETWQAGRPRPRTHCVRWEPSSPFPKGAQSPIFGPYLLWSNGDMDQDATWHGCRPSSTNLPGSRPTSMHAKCHLNPSSHLATTDMCRKLGAVPLWRRGSWVPI